LLGHPEARRRARDGVFLDRVRVAEPRRGQARRYWRRDQDPPGVDDQEERAAPPLAPARRRRTLCDLGPWAAELPRRQDGRRRVGGAGPRAVLRVADLRRRKDLLDE